MQGKKQNITSKHFIIIQIFSNNLHVHPLSSNLFQVIKPDSGSFEQYLIPTPILISPDVFLFTLPDGLENLLNSSLHMLQLSQMSHISFRSALEAQKIMINAHINGSIDG